MSRGSAAAYLLGHPAEAATIESALDLLEVPDGTVLAKEGERERDMYVIIAGEASQHRAQRELGRLCAGDVIGAIELVTGRPRRVTIVAHGGLVVRRLSHGQFEQFAAREPAVALGFVRRVLETATREDDDAPTDVLGTIQPEDPRATQEVEVTIRGEKHRVRIGTRLQELLPSEVDGEPVVAGLIDRRPVSLVASLRAGGVVEPLTTAHWEGGRVYRRSVGLLLLEAAGRYHPDLEVQLEYSLGYAQRVRVRGNTSSWQELADELNRRMVELVEQDLPLAEKWWTVDEARAHFERIGWHSAAELLGTSRDPTGRVVTFGHVHALRTDPIVPRTGMLSGFCVVPASDGLVLVHGEVDDLAAAPRGQTLLAPGNPRSHAATIIARRSETMMRDHAYWLETMGVTDVAELNRACINGDVSHLIRVAEGFHEKRVSQIADAIAARHGRVKVVTIAGPSSSGKSTFIKRLRVQLLVDRIHPHEISIDDYYLPRGQVPRGPDGEPDLEAFEALRSDLLQSHLARLLGGEAVSTARFDFRTGRSEPEGGPRIELGTDDILIVEGIHGLNPKLLGSIPETEVFRVFVCPLAQLPFDRLSRVHASDLRLLRRIVRDRHGRNTNASETITRWPSVRDGERKHIFAYQHHADEVFDSSLIYELSVLRVFAERYLLEVPQDHCTYTTAYRLLRLLDHFVTVYPDHVPPTSILREFIGTSGFDS